MMPRLSLRNATALVSVRVLQAGTGAVLLTPGWLRCIPVLCETPVPYGITIALAARRDLLLLTQRLVVLVTTAPTRFKLA